ncbi:MAG: NACHT domain-containing protein [Pseudonocardia sp.]
MEAFLAVLLTARSGGRTAGVADVQDILARFPTLVVLDGLDEVARDDARARVVREIDQFVARLATDTAAHPQVVVTTRPNASGLPEPTPDSFETIALARLGPVLRTSHLRKWADVRGIRGRARRELQRTFDQRSSEPHIAQLADNPMQLTILLYLRQRRGVSVPTARTELCTSYMQTFLNREARPPRCNATAPISKRTPPSWAGTCRATPRPPATPAE